ncbi:MAG: ribulose-phosphate 3-epimerase [Candidatus Omnitrophica bacterium 4484_213]|nr:MAG: ribulose-phosphate 3-epimerase [Candidatus Omnitrophica bacterium 4484_213]
MPKFKIAPSILSANFADLRGELRKISNADLVHIDVMDGHFVPNITFGPLVVKTVKKEAAIPLDVHLMIEEPTKFISDFISAGADLVSVHIEAAKEKSLEIIGQIKSLRARAGIALNPQTPLSAVEDIISEVDFVLLMSVQPGFAGQRFREEVIPKIKQLRREWKGDIEVDGGINRENYRDVIQAGANILVAASAIFSEACREGKEPQVIIKEMKDEGNKVWH